MKNTIIVPLVKLVCDLLFRVNFSGNIDKISQTKDGVGKLIISAM